MLNDLFMNSLILISFTLIIGNVLKDIPEETTSRLCYKIILGLIGGMLGILVIFYNIKIVNTPIIIDLRVLALMIMDYIGGTIPVVITSIILGLYRLFYNGINQASIIAVIAISLYLMSFILINSNIKNRFIKWCLKLAAVLLLSDLSYLYQLWNKHILDDTLLLYSITLLAVGLLEFFLLEYVRNSNDALKMYKENSTKDFLTGLNNTRSFDFLANTAFKSASEKNEKLSCLMIDIDYFKKVNDTYGHASGDLVLKELATILTKNCRSYDIVSRVGGEEFCILLPDCSIEKSFELGFKIKNSINVHNFPIADNKCIKITASIGISTFPDLVHDIYCLKEDADKALYNAKHSGRDRVCDNSRCIV